MQYGIQRRTIYLIPPTPEDLQWLFELFDTEEIWTMFGFEGPSKKMITERHAQGNIVVGIIYRVQDQKRIGFCVSFPPTWPADAWEFGTAIVDPADRDAYSAIHAGDATAHYMFDHANIERAMWRIREDNRASNAIARRMGYRPYGGWDVGGHRFNFYRLSKERWAERYAQLDRGEEKNPSGLEETFLTLSEPPYTPKPLKSSSSGSEEG